MEALSEHFRALGDPTRLRLLRLLEKAPLNVSEMVSIVGVAQSSVSHHLAKLRHLNLIREERQASYSFYSLAVEQGDARWPLIQMAAEVEDDEGDLIRLQELLRQREDRQAQNERLLEPGQSWLLWAHAVSQLLPSLTVADFGCGTGVLSVAMAEWAHKVWAIDKNREALKRARARASRQKRRNVTFLEEDLHRLSLPDASVDLVVISQSLHHVEQPEAVLSEAFRLLRPGGRVLVLELHAHDETWVKEQLGHRHLGFSPPHLKQALQKAGFRRTQLDNPREEARSGFRVFFLMGVKP